MKDNDAILALLEDIKETLWGIALLILGVFVGLAGILYARRGYGRYEVVEKQE